jgi:hypothetical protein
MFADRVAFYTPTTGTGGPLDVGDAIDGSVYTPAEAGVEDGASGIHYTIRQGTDVEFCTGGYADGTPATLSRTTVKSKIGGVTGTDPIDLNGTAVVAFVADAALFNALLTTDVIDTDGTLAADSDSKVPSQKAVKTYADALIAANDAMVFKGVIDCSANPNYPAADSGHTYRVSLAGKIGGGSGLNVEAGDILLCLTDSTASGNQATVGSAWTIVQANLDGAVIGPASATDGNLARFDGTSGKLIKGDISLSTDTSLSGNSDTVLPSQKAVKAYVDAHGADIGKQSIWVPAGAMIPFITNGAAVGLVEMSTFKWPLSSLDFDATTQEYAGFGIRMPKSWNEGTVTFIPVWSHASTTTNFGVVWSLSASAVSDDDAGDASVGTPQTSTDTGGTTNDIYQGPESGAITIAGTPATGDWVQFRISRSPSNASDTMAIDARLVGILLLYTIDALKDD